MKTPNRRIPALLAAALTVALVFTGCAVSPDYSNYDLHERGGMVDEPDRSLAAARIEPFQGSRRTARTDVSITPSGATPAEQQAVIIDPGAPDIVAEGGTRRVSTSTTTTARRTP